MAKATKEDYRQKAIEEYGERCKLCESVRNIRVHHIDGDRHNNDLGNLLVVCSACHAEIHSPKRSGRPYDKYTNHLPESALLGSGGKDTNLITTSVAIRDDQKDWLDGQNFSLSALVREAIDDKIDELSR